MWLWVVLVLASTPCSLPSLYLAHKLVKKRFLERVFNQHIALMMVFAGDSTPDIDTDNMITMTFQCRSHTSLQLGQSNLETPH